MPALPLLRLTGKIEAVSFLLLLGIAMPLKYAAGLPEALKIVGWVHGLLFIIFCLALARAKMQSGLSIGMSFLVFIAALLPFGPFLIDSHLKHLDENT